MTRYSRMCVGCQSNYILFFASKNMYETPSVSSEGIYADLSKRWVADVPQELT
jgi:hypothetical protein